MGLKITTLSQEPVMRWKPTQALSAYFFKRFLRILLFFSIKDYIFSVKLRSFVFFFYFLNCLIWSNNSYLEKKHVSPLPLYVFIPLIPITVVMNGFTFSHFSPPFSLERLGRLFFTFKYCFYLLWMQCKPSSVKFNTKPQWHL